MRLFTIQSDKIIPFLKSRYIVDDNNIIKEFSKAYDWLAKDMASKIKKPEDVNYPIWGWYRFENKNKPDIRNFNRSWGNKGDKFVLIELEIPEDKVLLTDFDAWHFVLGDFYLSMATNEKEYDLKEEYYNSLSENEKQNLKEKSWQNIYNIEMIENEFVCRGKYVQATFWELLPEYILNIKSFKIY